MMKMIIEEKMIIEMKMIRFLDPTDYRIKSLYDSLHYSLYVSLHDSLHGSCDSLPVEEVSDQGCLRLLQPGAGEQGHHTVLQLAAYALQ